VRICARCKSEEPPSGFYRRSDYKDGLDPWCKICRKSAAAEWAGKNPEKRRASYKRWRQSNGAQVRENGRRWARNNAEKLRDKQLRLKFGITLEAYHSLLAAQGGGCAICASKSPGGRDKNFAVDHDHVNGRVRGLLCRSCNLGLGFFRDNPALLTRGAAYVGEPGA
jgi:hypothetical protein